MRNLIYFFTLIYFFSFLIITSCNPEKNPAPVSQECKLKNGAFNDIDNNTLTVDEWGESEMVPVKNSPGKYEREHSTITLKVNPMDSTDFAAKIGPSSKKHLIGISQFFECGSNAINLQEYYCWVEFDVKWAKMPDSNDVEVIQATLDGEGSGHDEWESTQEGTWDQTSWKKVRLIKPGCGKNSLKIWLRDRAKTPINIDGTIDSYILVDNVTCGCIKIPSLDILDDTSPKSEETEDEEG